MYQGNRNFVTKTDQRHTLQITFGDLYNTIPRLSVMDSPIDAWSFLPKTHFLDILENFRLDLGQTSSNLPKRNWQHDSMSLFLLASCFTTFFAQEWAEIKIFGKWPTSLDFLSFLNFFFAFPFSHFLFFLLQWFTFYWACSQLKKNSEKTSSRWAIFTMEEPRLVPGNFALSFSLNFLSIFVHISVHIEPITLIWASLERSFSAAFS